LPGAEFGLRLVLELHVFSVRETWPEVNASHDGWMVTDETSCGSQKK
jgi:hypothetical protein